MIRSLFTIAMLLAAAVAEGASIRFLSPLAGEQMVGPGVIEIATDAAGVDRVEFSVDGVLAGVARKPPFRIAFDFGTALEPREIAVRVFSNGFKTSETAKMRTASLTAGESMSVDLVEVPLRVRAQRSRAITAGDLRLSENSVVQTIRSVTPGRGPAEFVFVVDRSLSMRNGKLESALQAVSSAARMLRPDDTASLILFNHNVSRPLSVLPRNASSEMAASGGTALRDALASVGTDRRTYTIVITDGGDRNSVLSEDEALRKISNARTSISAVVLGDAGRFLHQATGNTGGTLRQATVSTIAVEVQRILADINSRYTLVYQSSGSSGRGWRTITIQPRSTAIDIVSARKGYYAQ